MNRSSRSTSSKNLLVTAAGELIRDRGVEGVRVREVAAIAGMSPGSVVYHYPDTNDLIFDVHRSAVNAYIKQRADLAASFDDPQRSLLAAVASGLPSATSDNATIRLMYEMHATAQRSERHSALLTSLWENEHRLHIEIIERGVAVGIFTPSPDAEGAARALLVLEDGLALHMTSDTAFTYAAAMGLFRTQAAHILACHSINEKDHSAP